jgi:hypothetical protein
MNDRILVLNPPVIGGRSMNDRILVLNPPVIGGRSLRSIFKHGIGQH